MYPNAVQTTYTCMVSIVDIGLYIKDFQYFQRVLTEMFNCESLYFWWAWLN